MDPFCTFRGREYGLMVAVGYFTIILSVVEFGVGGNISRVLDITSVGGWWAGIFPFLIGVISLMEFRDKRVKIVAGVFALLGFINAIMAAVIDSDHANTLYDLDGCINTKTGATYGSDEAILASAVCRQYDLDFKTGGTDSTCVCADNSNACYGYNLYTTNDCKLLYTSLFDQLSTSSVICSALAIITFINLSLAARNGCIRQPTDNNNFGIRRNNDFVDLPDYHYDPKDFEFGDSINEGESPVFVYSQEMSNYNNPLNQDNTVFVNSSELPPVFIGTREGNDSESSDSRHSPIQNEFEDSHFIPQSDVPFSYQPQEDYE